MSTSFDFPRPSRVTVGAVGPPGSRVFYFQARQEDELVSLKLEKEQVVFLAGGLSEVLADLATPGTVPGENDLALEEPVEAEWVVGSMQLAYDPAADRIVVTAKEVEDAEEDDQDDVEGGTLARGPLGGVAGETGTAASGSAASPPGTTGAATAPVALTRDQAAGVIQHGKRLLRGGRPPCPLCGFPLGEDHSCPKTNGHRPPAM